MKIAICISGQPRNLNKSYPGIKEKLLDPYSPDVFIHTWYNKEDIGTNRVNSWGHKIEENLNQFTLSNIFEKYNPKKFKIENQINFCLPLELQDTNYHFNMTSMLYSMNEANNLKKQYEAENNFKYDVVIRTRFDLNILDELNILSLDLNNKIHCLNDCSHYNGVNDQFAIGNSQNMDIFNSSYNIISEFIDDYKNWNISTVCGETIVYYNSWIKHNIEVFPLSNGYKLLRHG